MSAFRTLIGQHEARASLAIWAIVPTVFLFFALTLAVDPTAHLDRLRLGATVLDAGATTPAGQVSIGPRLIEGLGGQLHAEVISYPTEADLRDAVLAHKVAGGILVPAGTTQAILGGQPATLQIVRSDANDPFTNAFTTNLAAQIAANINAALPVLAGGATPQPPLVSVATTNVAPTTDYRFATVPAALLLPLWMATVAFAALLSRAGDRIRSTVGRSRTALVELGTAVLGAGIAATVISLDIALFTWRSDLSVGGLFGLLWLGLTAIALVLLGTIRAVGLPLGVLLGIVALFVQQPVSGAAFPSAFAPDVVRWAEPIAPLRYLVEGVRNLLIGGATTFEMAVALALVAGAGVALYLLGLLRLAFVPGRSHGPMSAQPV
ncbi:MAG TPA: ABC transporter permease [Candidatus Limnocylindrales bacterium]|jgi:hypothetical protein|nr:ABC transporter permease [Candidatus Limnocylindrales bacterium]